MLIKQVLLVLCCIYQLNAYSVYPPRSLSVNQHCENIPELIENFHANGLNEIQTFQTIAMSVLQQGYYPQELISLINTIGIYAQKGIISLDQILSHVIHEQLLNSKYDVLLAILVRINESSNADCYVKDEISKAIYFLVKKKYLNSSLASYDQISSSFGSCTEECDVDTNIQPTNQVVPALFSQKTVTPNSDCCYANLIHSLVEKLMNMTSIISRSSNVEGSGIAISRAHDSKDDETLTPNSDANSMKLTNQNYENYELVYNIVNKLPKREDDNKWRKKMVEFLFGAEGQQFLKLHPFMENDSIDNWLLELEKYVEQLADIDLTDSVHYYLKAPESKQRFVYDLLPSPAGTEDQEDYNKLYLLLKDVNNYIPNFTFTNEDDNDEFLFSTLLQLLSSPNLPENSESSVINYLTKLFEDKYKINLKDLLGVIPSPESPEEMQLYNKLISFLLSPDFVELYNSLISNGTTEPIDILQAALKYLKSKPEYSSVVENYRKHAGMLQMGVDPFHLIHQVSLLDEDMPYKLTLEDFFYTPDFKNIVKKVDRGSKDEMEYLHDLLQAMAENAQDGNVKSAAKYLLLKTGKGPFLNLMHRLIKLIPEQHFEKDKMYYDILTNFLISDDAYLLFGDFDFSLFPDDVSLLTHLLRIIASSENKLSHEVVEASKAFLTVPMFSIDLVTKKEIKRHFKLTEIFTDTLNIPELNLEQKNAFKMFFAYISKIQPETISKFTNWDQASTRGEFMKLLFTFLLELPETPNNIKESIISLAPLVQFTGAAALPP